MWERERSTLHSCLAFSKTRTKCWPLSFYKRKLCWETFLKSDILVEFLELLTEVQQGSRQLNRLLFPYTLLHKYLLPLPAFPKPLTCLYCEIPSLQLPYLVAGTVLCLVQTFKGSCTPALHPYSLYSPSPSLHAFSLASSRSLWLSLLCSLQTNHALAMPIYGVPFLLGNREFSAVWKACSAADTEKSKGWIFI